MKENRQSRKLKIAVLVDKELPTDHSFIKGVLEDNLPDREHHVAFLGFGQSAECEPSENIGYRTIKRRSSSFILAKLEKLFRFTRELYGCDAIDVLYTRNDPVYLIIGWWLKKRRKIKIHLHQISHLHAYSTMEKRRGYFYRIKSWGDRSLRRLFLNSADQLMLVSEEMKAFVKEIWPYYIHRLTVYPLGVNRADFRPPIPYKERTLDLVYIGTLATSRRVGVILEAVKHYNDKLRKVELHIWGRSHEPSDDAELEKYAHALKIADCVHFNGQIGRGEVIEKICDSRVGLSTIPAEGLLKQISPTKLMEYMAAGCAVIASRGIPEQDKIIGESGGGLMVEYNPKEIAEAIQSLLNNPDVAEEMAAKGRAYILKNRSYESMADDLREDIKCLLSKSCKDS